MTSQSTPRIRRIATEEAFMIPEQLGALKEFVASGGDDPDVDMWKVLLSKDAEVRISQLLDSRGDRIRKMDEYGVDVFVLSLTSPGVQMLPADRAAALARLANDYLAETVRSHPGRYAGLATIAPQDPAWSVKEMERAIRQLGLNGFVINSHTNGEYLDDPKFWPILEAAEALDAPIYLHPRAPSKAMAQPYRIYNLENALWGYQAETGLHAIRMISSGLFDRFPNLKIVLGHMGEGIPFWLWRIDYMHSQNPMRPKVRKLPSEYFRDSFYITTSGMNWNPTLEFCMSVLGPDKIMFAIDYPYQRPAAAVAFMNNAPISLEDKQKIFATTAERVFKIAAPS
jgi:predicted TIM-barrel fold metal-dependent hydrolase